MATQPPEDQPQRRNQAAALALLAIGFNLPALIKAAKVRPRPFRKINPTEALRSTMAAPYFVIAAAWAAERDALTVAYATARTSGDSSAIVAEMRRATARVMAKADAARQQAANALRSLDTWHSRQWAARIKTATRLDLGQAIPANTSFTLGNALHWADQLITDMVQQTGGAIAGSLQAGLAADAPVGDAVSGISAAVAKARKRAANIGVDQTDRTSAQLDRDRRQALGLDSFIWRHSPHVRHPRPEHVARDGRRYTEANAPNDRAGTLYGCQCWEEPNLQP